MITITQANGDAKQVRNWLHAFGVLHPFTLAIAAAVVGNLVGAFLHI